MPTPDAERREDAVVHLVELDLRESGRTVELLDRPDRHKRRSDGLTTDAVFRVDGSLWATDVTTLRWHHNLESRVRKLTSRLEREFGQELKATGMTLYVTCHVLRDDFATESIASLVELARAAITSGHDQVRGDEAAQLRPRESDSVAVVVQPWLTHSAKVVDEVVGSLGPALRKKLTQQLTRARPLGYITCLVVDLRGASDLKFGANFLPSPETVAEAIELVEAEVGIDLDRAALIRENDSVIWLRI